MIFTLYKHLCFAFRKTLFNSTAHYIIFVMLTYYIVMSLFRITYIMHLFEFNLRELTKKNGEALRFIHVIHLPLLIAEEYGQMMKASFN
jgi:hypothetical protein